MSPAAFQRNGQADDVKMPLFRVFRDFVAGVSLRALLSAGFANSALMRTDPAEAGHDRNSPHEVVPSRMLDSASVTVDPAAGGQPQVSRLADNILPW